MTDTKVPAIGSPNRLCGTRGWPDSQSDTPRRRHNSPAFFFYILRCASLFLGVVLPGIICNKPAHHTLQRQRFNANGELADASTQLTVSVRPGWKKGTKITFPGEGDEGPGVLPADVLLVVTER